MNIASTTPQARELVSLPRHKPAFWTKLLLATGAVSSVLYLSMDVIGQRNYPGYNVASQAVSELSAIDAPSRPFMVPLGLIYNLLVLAFAWGVWRLSANNRPLRIASWLLLAFGALGFAAPFTSMHMRGSVGTLTDTLHVVSAMVDVILMFLVISFGAEAFGKRFRWYSIVTIVALLVFGILTIPGGARIAANEPTPWLGVYERINIGVYMLWIIVFASRLWRLTEEHPK